MSIGENIKKFRESKNLTQRLLANALGLTLPTAKAGGFLVQRPSLA